VDDRDHSGGRDRDVCGRNHDVGDRDRDVGGPGGSWWLGQRCGRPGTKHGRLVRDLGGRDRNVGGRDRDVDGRDRDVGGRDRDVGGRDRDVGGQGGGVVTVVSDISSSWKKLAFQTSDATLIQHSSILNINSVKPAGSARNYRFLPLIALKSLVREKPDLEYAAHPGFFKAPLSDKRK
jgi:hypothetical protein